MSLGNVRFILSLFLGTVIAQIMSFYAYDCFPNIMSMFVPVFIFCVIFIGALSNISNKE